MGTRATNPRTNVLKMRLFVVSVVFLLLFGAAMCNPYLPTYPTTTRPPPSPPSLGSLPTSCRLWKQFRSSVSDPAASRTKGELQINCSGRKADKCNLCPKAWCSQDCSWQNETASGCVDKGVNTAETRVKAVSSALKIMEAVVCPAAGPGGQAILSWPNTIPCFGCLLNCGISCFEDLTDSHLDPTRPSATSATLNVLPAPVLGDNLNSCRLWYQFKQSFQDPFGGTSKQVNCGDHSATWCGACPGQGSGGAASCREDCRWVENEQGAACVDNGENFQIERKTTASALQILEAAACPKPGVQWFNWPWLDCALCIGGCALTCLFPL